MQSQSSDSEDILAAARALKAGQNQSQRSMPADQTEAHHHRDDPTLWCLDQGEKSHSSGCRNMTCSVAGTNALWARVHDPCHIGSRNQRSLREDLPAEKCDPCTGWNENRTSVCAATVATPPSAHTVQKHGQTSHPQGRSAKWHCPSSVYMPGSQ